MTSIYYLLFILLDWKIIINLQDEKEQAEQGQIVSLVHQTPNGEYQRQDGQNNDYVDFSLCFHSIILKSSFRKSKQKTEKTKTFWGFNQNA